MLSAGSFHGITSRDKLWAGIIDVYVYHGSGADRLFDVMKCHSFETETKTTVIRHLLKEKLYPTKQFVCHIIICFVIDMLGKGIHFLHLGVPYVFPFKVQYVHKQIIPSF